MNAEYVFRRRAMRTTFRSLHARNVEDRAGLCRVAEQALQGRGQTKPKPRDFDISDVAIEQLPHLDAKAFHRRRLRVSNDVGGFTISIFAFSISRIVRDIAEETAPKVGERVEANLPNAVMKRIVSTPSTATLRTQGTSKPDSEYTLLSVSEISSCSRSLSSFNLDWP